MENNDTNNSPPARDVVFEAYSIVASIEQKKEKRKIVMENCEMKVIYGDTSNFSPTRNTVLEASIVASTEQNMLDEKKRRRKELSRVYSQRSVLKKKVMMANLENQAKILEDHMARLEQEEAFYQNEKQHMKVEEQRLYQEIEVFEKQRLLRHAEGENNMGKATRMRELQVKKDEQVDS